MKKMLISCLVMIFILAIAAAAHATSIGIELYGQDAASFRLTPTDSAGVFPQQYYNSTKGDVSPLNNLLDGTGATSVGFDGTSVKFTWNATGTVLLNTFSDGISLTTADSKLLSGGIRAIAGSTLPSVLTFTFQNVPDGSYDLVIYTEFTTGGPFRASAGGATYYGLNSLASSYAGSFTRVTSTSSASPTQGNYVEFDNLSPDASHQIVYSFAVNSTTAGVTAGTNGVQLIAIPSAVPEPATMLLLGSGLIGLAGYGRKRFFRK